MLGCVTAALDAVENCLKSIPHGLVQAFRLKLDRWNCSEIADGCTSTNSPVIVTEGLRVLVLLKKVNVDEHASAAGIG